MPETLDETYERILRGINKAQREDARRLLQCLTVAARPLRVEELAELLAFDFRATKERGVPTLKKDWRWNDQEAAVLSTCSSLIAIVRDDDSDSQVVQFSHFSVKEYLTSPRLARSPGDVSRFHIDLNAAHTILAQACLGTLLQLGEDTGNSGSNMFPLVEYAARHWVEHAQFENVSSRVRDGMDDLFDSSKPHFAAWLRVHDIDERWAVFSDEDRDGVGSPLYYAAFCGFYDLAERLIVKHPEQVNARRGRILSPLPAALSNRHFRVANLLFKHGAVVDVRDLGKRTPLYVAAWSGSVDIMQWLLNHGAEASAETDFQLTPLHMAVGPSVTKLKAVQMLLEHNIDVNSRDNRGETPLHDLLNYADLSEDGETVETVRKLLERGADQNIRGGGHSTPLHQAASKGWLEVARLLISYGAKVDETDGGGKTPYQVAFSGGFHELTKLLLEHGAVPPP
jgi:ankyrin repeat protein